MLRDFKYSGDRPPQIIEIEIEEWSSASGFSDSQG
jgi:hypothetical protein